MASDTPRFLDVPLTGFQSHLSVDQARALYEVLQNIDAKALIDFSSTTSEAWHASQALEKLTTWLLAHAMCSMRDRLPEPPDDE